MHESGLIRRLLAKAQAEARHRGATLRAVHIRLGALAGGSAQHLREHLEQRAHALGLSDLALRIEEAPDRPTGVELVAVDLRKLEDPGTQQG